MSADLFGMSTATTNHDVTLTLPGSIDSLRSRLAEGLELLDYKLIGDDPLLARRAARGSARWGCSLEGTDYPSRLTVTLKQLNEATTAATFDYEVKSYSCLRRGDRQMLDCEARALGAIAAQRDMATTCTACGTSVSDQSRFCRRCGALVEVALAEVEILRLMEDSRRGYHKVASGVILSLLALLIPMILIWIDTSKALRVVTILSSISGVFGMIVLIQGLWQLHRSLNPIEKNGKSTESVKTLAAAQTKALRPRSAQSSVTEGTTELLFPDAERREAVRIVRKSVDTAEVR